MSVILAPLYRLANNQPRLRWTAAQMVLLFPSQEWESWCRTLRMPLSEEFNKQRDQQSGEKDLRDTTPEAIEECAFPYAGARHG